MEATGVFTLFYTLFWEEMDLEEWSIRDWLAVDRSMRVDKAQRGDGAGFSFVDACPGSGESGPAVAVRSNVSGIILAGAQTWGDCVLERVIPRALVPLANRPLVSHALDWLSRYGVGRASICGSRNTQTMRRVLSGRRTAGVDGFDCGSVVPEGMVLDYYEDVAPRGPAGSIRDAGIDSGCDTFLVVEGTIIPCVNAGGLLDAHYRSGAGVTVVVSRESRNGHLEDAGMTPTGVYVFSRSALERIPAAGYADIKETLIPRLYADRIPVLTYRSDVMPPRVTGVDAYLAANAWVLTQLAPAGALISDGGAVCGGSGRAGTSAATILSADAKVSADGDVFADAAMLMVDPSAEIDETVRLIGPVQIGAGSVIGRGVTIVGPTTVGAGCRIGVEAVICRSAIWDACDIDDGTVLDSCIMTHGSETVSGSSCRYVVFTGDSRRGRLGSVGCFRSRRRSGLKRMGGSGRLKKSGSPYSAFRS